MTRRTLTRLYFLPRLNSIYDEVHVAVVSDLSSKGSTLTDLVCALPCSRPDLRPAADSLLVILPFRP